jgi:hypothetical protein
MFIKAQNQSISSDDYILGTPLTTNTYYCIQTITDKNETVFLKWDGIQYENYWGLNLHKLNDDQCPYDDKHFFELEFKYGHNPNILIMKNKALNEYISIYKDNSFALAHDTREKDSFIQDSYYDNTLTFIVSNDDSIKIGSRWNGISIYMGTKCDNTYSNRINSGLSYYDSLNLTFIRARNGSNNKISFKNIFALNIILFLIIFYYFDL